MLNKLNKPFLIAELSANHDGKLNNAIKLIKYAKKFGADAVKLQTYTPDWMTLKSKKNISKSKKVCGQVIHSGIYTTKEKLLLSGIINYLN